MKISLLLLFSCACFGQSMKLDSTSISNVYKGLKYSTECRESLKVCESVADELHSQVLQRESEIQQQNVAVRELVSEISELRDKLEAKRIEAEKIKCRAKRFGLGVSAGVDVYGRPCLNIGVNWSVFRF